MGTLSVDKILKTSTGAAEFTLPATDGTAGQVWQTDGAGQISVAALAADTVGTSQISALAVDTAEIAANAVDGSKIAMGSDAAGDVLYYNGTDYVRLGAGTASQTFKMNSGATAPEWATVAAASDNTPAFQAYLSANQAINHASTDKVLFNTEDFDTDNAYDNSTNYRFTVPAGEGGKYFVYFRLTILGNNTKNEVNTTYINVNGSTYLKTEWNFKNNPGEIAAPYNAGIITLAAGDYVECSVYLSTENSSAGAIYSASRATVFGAYKMIGI